MNSNRTVSVVTVVGMGLALLLVASPGLAQTLTLNGADQTVTGIALSTSSIIQNGDNSSQIGGATLNVDTTTGDAVFSGAMQDSPPTVLASSDWSYNSDVGNLNLNKIGTGTLTVSGTNIYYLGNTTVSGGTLVLSDCIYFNADYQWNFPSSGPPANTISVSAGAVLQYNLDPSNVTGYSGTAAFGPGYLEGEDGSIGAAGPYSNGPTTLSGAGTFQRRVPAPWSSGLPKSVI